MIDIFGADHGGYVKRLKSAVKAITDGNADIEVKLCQMINFKDNGVPMKMSKRSGTFITLRDVIDEVGKDVTRFLILTRKNDAHLDFDFAKVKETSKDNVVFYVQYAHARACSVNRNALEMFKDKIDITKANLSLLNDPDEIALMKLLSTWPRLIEGAALATEPHRIAYFLNDIASAFHSLWNKGRDDASLKFLIENNIELSAARLALVNAVAIVIASGLEVFGVKPMEEM
ncbi:MAG: Arginine--tRNA ligase [Alphaproteobacteria bacterium ADurb.Bin438]|nr:MAG: Arginine--tRNA ligase [Alphaproteobacteria bacterium ADurb.Bin438]